MKRVGTNSPSLGSNIGVDLPDFAAGKWEQVMSNTAAGFESASQAQDAQAQMFNQKYQNSMVEWENAEKRRRAEWEAKQQGGFGDIGSALVGIGKQLLAGYTLQEEVKSRQKAMEAQTAQQNMENQWKERQVSLQEQQFQYGIQSSEQKAEQQQLETIWEAKLTSLHASINENIGQVGREKGVASAKEAYNTFLGTPEYQALPDGVKYKIALDVNKQFEKLTGESADTIFAEKQKQSEGIVNNAVQQYNLEYSAGLQKLRTAGSALTPDEAMQLSRDLLDGADTMVANSDTLKVAMSDPRQSLNFRIQVVKQVGDGLNEYYKMTGTQAADAQNYVLASQELRALEAFRDSGEINEAQYQAKAKELLLSRGIQTDPSKMPTSSVQIMDSKLQNLQQRNQYAELIAKDRNTQSILGEQTPQGQALVRRNIGTSLYNNINGNNVEVRIAELKALESSSPEIAQAVKAPAERQMLEGYFSDRTRLTKLNQQTAQIEGEIARLGYQVNPPKAVEYLQQPNTPLGIGAGVSTEPSLTLVPAPNRVPTAPIEALDAKKAELQALFQERDVLMYRWKQYGVNLSQPADKQFLNQLEADSQASADEVARRASAAGINGTVPPASLSASAPTTESVKYEKVRGAVITEALNSGYHQTPPLPSNVDQAKYQAEYQKSATNIVQLIYEGQPKEALNFVTFHGEQSGLDEGLLETQRNRLQKLYEFTYNKQQWYNQKLTGQSRPTSQPRPTSNFSEGSVKKPQVALPENEGVARPAMPLKGNLAVVPNLGFSPYKGGQPKLIPSSTNPNGITLVNETDSRVATLQGGRVVYAGNGTVLVKTQDGHTESFNGLSKFTVKKGDVLQPAQQIGTSGDKLNFEVWTGKAEDPSASNVDKGFTSPVMYLSSFQTKVDVPVSGGIRNSQSINNTQYSGALKLTENLVYFNGYIMDKSNMQMRKSVPSDDVLISRGIPIGDTRKIPQQSFQQNTPTGGRTVSYYEPPNEAKIKEHYVFVKPAGYNDKNGQPVYLVEGYDKGRRMFSRPVTQSAVQRESKVQVVNPIDGIVKPIGGKFSFQGKDFQYKVKGEAVRPDGSTHKGIDIFANSGSEVKSPFSGEVVYAEKGHTRTAGDPYSVLVKLDKPVTVNGKTVDHVYMTHMKQVGVQAGQRVEAGMPLGQSGFAVEDHLHLGLVNRDQSVWLSEGEMYDIFFQGSSQKGGLPDGNYKVDKTGASVTGNMNFFNPKDKEQVSQFIRNRNGTSMYVSSVPKTKTVSSGINDYTGKPMEVGGLSIYKHDYAPSNPDDDYGVSELQKDARLRQAYHTAASKIGVPTVWLVDQTLGESGLVKGIRGGDGGNYTGLIQFGKPELAELGKRLEGKAFTPNTLSERSIYWQLETLIPEYFKWKLELAGKQGKERGIQNYEDMIVLVWGGQGGYLRTPEARKRLADSNVNYEEYLNHVVGGGRKLGRSYNWTTKRSSTLHAAPRDGCPVCQAMTRSNSFSSHYYYG